MGQTVHQVFFHHFEYIYSENFSSIIDQIHLKAKKLFAPSVFPFNATSIIEITSFVAPGELFRTYIGSGTCEISLTIRGNNYNEFSLLGSFTLLTCLQLHVFHTVQPRIHISKDCNYYRKDSCTCASPRGSVWIRI